jgi:isopenicillin N synthase-like dioxygenase
MNVQTVDFKTDNAGKQLAESIRETGFAVLTNHPVSSGRIAEAYEAWAGFFADEKKHDWLFDKGDMAGFFPYKSENAKDAPQKDLKEFFHVYPWGPVPDDINDLTRALYKDLFDLGTILVGWLDDNIPDDIRRKMTGSLTDMMKESQQSLLRILHYPPVEADAEPDAIRAAAHEDINFITLLLAGSRPGLEAMDRSGAWHAISCDPGMITINSADMLTMATDGYYPSTKHRVVNPDAADGINESRYSMPMFLHPRGDAALKPDFTADMFLEERLKEIGLK